MKFNCGPSPEARAAKRAQEFKRLQEWHPFFAVVPRRVGENDCRMLEWIIRRGTLYQEVTITCFGVEYVWAMKWEYRAVKP